MYRLYFFYDFTDSLNFLKINPIWSFDMNSFLTHPHFIVKVYDWLCFVPFIKGGIYWLIFRKFLRNSVIVLSLNLLFSLLFFLNFF
jgi:hypothetical protein